MRRRFATMVGLGLILTLIVACGDDSNSPLAGNDGSGSEVVVSSELTAGDAVVDGSEEIEAASTSATEQTSTTTTASSVTPASTGTGDTGTDNTSSVTTRPDATGDAPALPEPTDIDEAGESPGVQTGLVPAFFTLEATTTVDCSDADPGTVNLRWEVIGVETVDISIGFIGNIRNADQPPAGTINLPLDCSTGSQYFVIAENADGETIRSVIVAAA